MNFDITYEGRTTLAVDREGALALGYPEAAIAAAEADKLVSTIKAECRRRIYAVASAETQMNMATAGAFASSKTASTRTAEENAVLSGLDASLAWVAQMRSNVQTLASDPSLDYQDDANWPVCPDAAVALAAKF